MPISEARMLQEIRNALARAVDGVTNAQQTIEYEHHEIHSGSSFTAHFQSSDPTNTGEETAMGFLTPAATSGRVHFLVDVQADELSTFEIREDPTITLNEGTALEPFNRDRDSTKNSAVRDRELGVVGLVSRWNVAEAAAADLSGGTIIFTESIGAAGTPNSFTSGESRGQREFVLKADTEYVIILTTLTDNTTTHNIIMNWYEHTAKNL